MRASMAMVVTAMIETLMHTIASPVQMTVDLATFLLEMPGLLITSPIGSTNCLAMKLLLNAITLSIKVSFDAFTLDRVTIMGPAGSARISHGRCGQTGEDECHYDSDDFLHGFVLSPVR